VYDTRPSNPISSKACLTTSRAPSVANPLPQYSAATRQPISTAGINGASKAGIEEACRYAAEELGSSGIRVNVVQPGIIDDELMSFITAGGKLLDDYLANFPGKKYKYRALKPHASGVPTFLDTNHDRLQSAGEAEESDNLLLLRAREDNASDAAK